MGRFQVCESVSAHVLRYQGSFLACVGFVQWSAPEVCAGTAEAGTVATAKSDVYMLGGLAYELLTAGTPPFHWLIEIPHLLALRRASMAPVAIPGAPGMTIPGLFGKNVLEVAAADRQSVPWCVRGGNGAGSAGRLDALKGLVGRCLDAEPSARPKVAALRRELEQLRLAEVQESESSRDGATEPDVKVWRGA